VNFDHIFAAALKSFVENEVSISRLKRVIYLSGVSIAQQGKYRTHPSIYEDNLVKIFNDEAHAEFDSVFDLAKKQNLIKQISNEEISINKDAFEKRYDFHEIRRENSLQVIVNEFTLLEVANDIVKRNAKTSDETLCKKVFKHIYNKDLEKFSSDYEIFFDKKFSKEKSVGSPFFLDVLQEKNPQKIGILISHGYKAAPKEIEALARYLNDLGFVVYATRLRGHGTAPHDLRDTTWQDWYESMQRGYSALRNICSKIIIVGFSTGGLLALLSGARKNGKNLEAIVSINAALKLVDIKASMVPGINMWNEMLEKFRIEKGRFEYVDDKPENPQINYSRNYIRSVNQLEKLMDICATNLKKISQKTLLIQANQDPVVNPESAKIIHEKISAKEKFLVEMDFSNHCIVNGPRKEEVFVVIKDFFSKLKIL
jgi:esterase/lipase